MLLALVMFGGRKESTLRPPTSMLPFLEGPQLFFSKVVPFSSVIVK